ncbi:hypothetical protein B0T21DRAFT_360945 [Apiosordaria backusii]|uniref:Uncharacterized protein n=1 Tax=Apiosordaria backusii TaxID=314023 RepID=A0AA40EMW4_9PEZI|nr:hypothetical protein B0T21DRAFT_360945 [Apiosordaria backusii]
MGFLGGTAQPPRPRDLSSSPIVLRGRNFILSSVVLKKGYIYWHLIPDNLQARNYLGHDAANPPQTKHVSPDFDIQELETKCRHFVGGQCGVLKSFVIDGKSVKKLHCRVTIW